MESRLPSPKSNPRLRLFWGIQAAPELGARIGAWRRESRSVLPSARWPCLEDCHLTLAFLGGRPAQERDAILAIGRDAVASLDAFTLRTAGLGAFPSLRKARILWLGFAAEPALARLASLLQRAMEPFGSAPEDGPFLPHLTLARFKDPIPLPVLAEIEASTLAVGAIHLFQSCPEAEGPKYRILGTVTLNT